MWSISPDSSMQSSILKTQWYSISSSKLTYGLIFVLFSSSVNVILNYILMQTHDVPNSLEQILDS